MSSRTDRDADSRLIKSIGRYPADDPLHTNRGYVFRSVWPSIPAVVRPNASRAAFVIDFSNPDCDLDIDLRRKGKASAGYLDPGRVNDGLDAFGPSGVVATR
jgi:hypothetical protein